MDPTLAFTLYAIAAVLTVIGIARPNLTLVGAGILTTLIPLLWNAAEQAFR